MLTAIFIVLCLILFALLSMSNGKIGIEFGAGSLLLGVPAAIGVVAYHYVAVLYWLAEHGILDWQFVNNLVTR